MLFIYELRVTFCIRVTSHFLYGNCELLFNYEIWGLVNFLFVLLAFTVANAKVYFLHYDIYIKKFLYHFKPVIALERLGIVTHRYEASFSKKTYLPYRFDRSRTSTTLIFQYSLSFIAFARSSFCSSVSSIS